MASDMPYRPEYVATLALLAKASATVRASGYAAPILVEGAVVEFDTGGQIMSGDFDFVSGADEPFAQALEALGFQRGDGQARRTLTFEHPALNVGVELVSDRYFDDLADRRRVRLVEVDGAAVSMAPTEDLIAGRLGQWEASNRKNGALLLQALALLRLAENLDLAYLDNRINQETQGSLGLAFLLQVDNEAFDP